MNRFLYLLTAQTQYNLHSPFVFDFYCNVLKPRLSVKALNMKGLSRSQKRNISLLYKIVDYYDVQNIAIQAGVQNFDFGASDLKKSLPHKLLYKIHEINELKNESFQNLGMLVCEIEQLNTLKDRLFQNTDNKVVVAVPHIHKNKMSELQWSNFQKDTLNILTIDIFSMGLVFCRKGLSKQDFILRY